MEENYIETYFVKEIQLMEFTGHLPYFNIKKETLMISLDKYVQIYMLSRTMY